MKFFIVVILALWAAFFYIHSINRMVKECDKKAKGVPFGLSIGIIAFEVVISVLAASISGLAGLIISAVILGLLGIFQFTLIDSHQFKGVTALSVPFALAAAYSKAGSFDAAKVFTQGFGIFKSLFWTFVIGVAAVAACGLLKWLITEGYFARLAAWLKGKKTDDDDEPEEADDDSGEKPAWLTPQLITTAIVAIAAVVVVVVVLI